MPPRLLYERALAPLPPPNALEDRELPRDELPPKSRLELLARFELDPPKSRLPELPPKSRLELPVLARFEADPPRSRVPALAFPALREPAASRVPIWLPDRSR